MIGVTPAGSSSNRLRARRPRRRASGWTLPAPLTSFVGRRRELDDLASLLEDRGVRLVTIVGPGGIGKTRLALEAARRLARDGTSVAFCDLSEASSRPDFEASVASSLGFVGAAHLGRSLAREGRCVVVLDNFEQIAAHAPVVTGWLRDAPEAVFVVTTRERLRIEGEHVLELLPLAHAGPDCDAVHLLAERGRAASSRFELAEADLPLAAEIVRALDGIPLAIELCAARLAVLGLTQLRDQLADGVLAVGAAATRGATPRHATLRATIEWSWALLDRDEQRTLARCSIFHGGFRLDAVRAVLELPSTAGGTADALEHMQALHDRSLVRVVAGASAGERRFSLYESVREFAAERLDESGERDRVRSLHAAHYLERGRALAIAADGPDGRRARDELALESANLTAIAREGRSPADVLAALLALEPIFSERGPLDPYADALDRAIAAAPPGPERARALLARARLDITRGRFDEGMPIFERAREEARAIGDERVAALATSKLGVLGAFLDREGAWARFDEAEVLARSIDDPRLEGICMTDRASALSRDGAEHAALAYHERALACFTRAGDARRRATALGWLGSACLATKRLADAERYTADAVDELRAFGDRRTEGQVLGFLARARHERGRIAEARGVFGAALGCLVAVGERWFEGVFEGWLGDLELEDERPDAAVRAYERAVRLLDLAGERPYAALFRSALVLARALVDGVEPAEPADVGGLPPTIHAAVALHEAHAAILREPNARDAARAALDVASKTEGSSSDVRLAARLLRRTLARLDAPVEGDDVLVVGPEARWFERRGIGRVRLDRHRSIRLVLLRLVEARIAAPGTAVPRADLIAAGWPGERIRADAAANRLNVSLTRLKRLGLRELLRTTDVGIVLDPLVSCKCNED